MKRFKPRPGLKRRVNALEDKVSALERELQSAKEIKIDMSGYGKRAADSMRRCVEEDDNETHYQSDIRQFEQANEQGIQSAADHSCSVCGGIDHDAMWLHFLRSNTSARTREQSLDQSACHHP